MFLQQIDPSTLPNKVFTIAEIRRVLEFLRHQQTERATSTRRSFWPQVLADETLTECVRRHHPSSMSAWHRLIVFRLSCCCGLRSKEICHLRLKDLVLHAERPHIRIRREATKANAKGLGYARAVPLWWDSATLDDLQDYEAYLSTRKGPEGEEDNPYVVYSTKGQDSKGPTKMLTRSGMRYKWEGAVAVLPPQRRLSIHCGRHSFCSHALLVGRTIVEVQKAAGHRWITTTQVYLHALENGTDLPDVFPEEEIDW